MTASDGIAAAGRDRLESVWIELSRLAAHFPEYRWKFPLLIVLGIAAAFAEVLGIGLGVFFLLAILGSPAALGDIEGPLAGLVARFGGAYDADLNLIAAILFILILLSAGLIYVHNVMTGSMANGIARRTRDLVHAQYVTVGYRWIQDQEQGTLVHTLGTEPWVVFDAFENVARMTVHLCAVLVFGAGLFLLSWQIAVTAGIAALVTFGIMRFVSYPLRKLSADMLTENQLLSERMMVSLYGMRTLRVFAQEEYVLRIFSRVSERVRALAVRVEYLKALNGPVGEIGSLGALVLIAVVASRVGIDVPTIITSALLLFRMQPHLRGIEGCRLALASMSPTLANVGQTLETRDKIWPTPGTIDFPGFASEIRFEAVHFSHDARRGPALDSVSFAIPVGKVTAISGPSGSGKSTIINLLLRLYEPQAGQITIDGVDLLSFTRSSWLGRLAIAGQDVELVEGTVAQNIRLARHDASMDEIREVCAMTGILADIEAIPEGFNARIGPAGLSFSGGQRQRIGLARALLSRPDFLILDEAMSALEGALEECIRHRIATAMEGKTILVVSHRPDALERADHVIHLKEGRVQPIAVVST